MIRLSASVGTLFVFVFVYVIAYAGFQNIASMGDIDLWKRQQIAPHTPDNPSLLLSRVKRVAQIDDMEISKNIELTKINSTLNVETPKVNLAPIYFQKCCSQDMMFNLDYVCVFKNATTDGNVIKWFPELKVINEINFEVSDMKQESIAVNYSSPKCDAAEIEVISWEPDRLGSYYISEKNGDLVVIDFASNNVTRRFSTASYCLESVERELLSYNVAILCPCNEEICVPKCCTKNQYYDMKTKSCTSLSDAKVSEDDDLKLKFYNRTEEVGYNLPYMFIEQLPQLGIENETLLFDKMGEDSILFIQENGSLLIQDGGDGHEQFLDRKGYCVDNFLDENNMLYPNAILSSSKLHVKFIEEQKSATVAPRNSSESKSIFSRINIVLVMCLSFILR